MANAIYPKYKNSLLQGDANSALSGSGATGLWLALVDTGVYTYSAAHQFYSDLLGVGATIEVTTVTTVGGLITGDNVTFLAVAGAVSYEALVLFRKNAGANTTWRLIAFEDTGITGLPVTSNGGDILVTWNASGILQL